LEGKADVDEGGYGLHGHVVLGMVEEVAHAGLEVGIPLEHIEIGVWEGL
jgi:hypothetical protein